MFKKVSFSFFSLLVALVLCACNSRSQTSNEVLTPLVEEKNEIEFVSSPLTAEFPEFLVDSDNLSILSRVIYNSFDYDKSNQNVENTIKDTYKCDRVYLNGRFYRFSSDGMFGIVDAEGEIILKPVYSDIIQIRPDLFELIADGKVYYASADSDTDIAIINGDSYDWVFKNDKPLIEQTTAVGAENVAESVRYSLKTPDRKIVYDRVFDLVSEAKKDSYTDDAKFVFTAYSEGISYIILFDKYYNYTVYEGSYGTIEVTMGEDSGKCCILSYDHYLKLLSLVSSFDLSEKKIISASDKTVTVKFSHYSGSESIVTICNNGYFEMTSVDSASGEQVTQKTTVSRECFCDVVEFVNSVISTEYTEE